MSLVKKCIMKKFFTIMQAILFVLIYWVLSFLFNVIIGLVFTLFISIVTNSNWDSISWPDSNLLMCISAFLSICCIYQLSKKFLGISLKTYQPNKFSFKKCLYCFVIGLMLSDVFSIIMSFVPKVNEMQKSAKLCVTSSQFISTSTTLIYLSIIAPIVEELLCRFILYNQVKKKCSVVFAILFSSFIFALMHLSVPLQVCYTFLLGIICCYCYYKTNNIILTILIHSGFNTNALVAGSLFELLKPNEFQQTLILIIKFLIELVIIACIYMFSRKISSKRIGDVSLKEF